MRAPRTAAALSEDDAFPALVHFGTGVLSPIGEYGLATGMLGHVGTTLGRSVTHLAAADRLNMAVKTEGSWVNVLNRSNKKGTAA